MRTPLVNPIVKLLGIALVIELGILTAVGIFGWRMDWETAGEYASTIELVGIFAFGVGLLGIKGNWDSSRSFQYQYSLSVTQESHWERTKLTIQDFMQTYTFMVVMFFVGGINLLIGLSISLIL